MTPAERANLRGYGALALTLLAILGLACLLAGCSGWTAAGGWHDRSRPSISPGSVVGVPLVTTATKRGSP